MKESKPLTFKDLIVRFISSILTIAGFLGVGYGLGKSEPDAPPSPAPPATSQTQNQQLTNVQLKNAFTIVSPTNKNGNATVQMAGWDDMNDQQKTYALRGYLKSWLQENGQDGRRCAVQFRPVIQIVCWKNGRPLPPTPITRADMDRYLGP